MLIKFSSATFVTFNSCPVFESFTVNIESQYSETYEMKLYLYYGF